MKPSVFATAVVLMGASVLPCCTVPPCPAPSPVAPSHVASSMPRISVGLVTTTSSPEPTEPTAAVDPATCVDAPRPVPDDQRSRASLAGGWMAPELIQATARATYPNLRQCYEGGLTRDRTLSGKITIRFVIGEDGTVTEARTMSNTMPDCGVVRCVREAFTGCKFPRPDGGPVTVIYPITLEPG